jgi:glycosyltransferase involved in cell wall biosynthesis
MLQTLGISDAKAKSDAQDKSVPLVSILMPTFKQEDFIRRAIDSVCAQTFAAWELIIVNDGSTDRTHDLVSSYLTDRRIRYHVFQQNQGVGPL